MPDTPQFTVAELAQKIKRKHLEYQKLSDQDAVNKFLEIYPGYANYLKKKEVSEPTSGVSSEPSATSDIPDGLNPFKANKVEGIGSSIAGGGGTFDTSFRNQLYGLNQGFGDPRQQPPAPRPKLDMAKAIKGMEAFKNGQLKDLKDFSHPELSQLWQQARAEAPDDDFLTAGIKATMDQAADAVPDFIKLAWEKGRIQGEKAKIMGTDGSLTDDDIQELARLNRTEQELGSTEEDQAFQEGGWQWVKNNKKAATKMIFSTIVQSLSAQLKASERTTPFAVGAGATAGSIIPGFGTAVGAVAGFTAGQYMAGFNLEVAGKVMDSLEEAGYDIEDPNELAKAFGNKELYDKALTAGIKRGVPIMAIDLATGGLAGRLGAAGATSRGFLRKTGLAAASFSTEAAGGGLGELAAQVSAGENLDWKSVALETAAEVGSGAPSLAGEVKLAGMETVKARKKTSASNELIATQIANDPETGEREAKENLTRLLTEGTITPEEHDQGVTFVDAAVEANDKIPGDIDPADRKEFVEVLAEKVQQQKLIGELTDQKAKADEAFHAALDQKINRARTKEQQLTEKLKTLIKERKKLPAHEEVQEATETEQVVEELKEESVQPEPAEIPPVEATLEGEAPVEAVPVAEETAPVAEEAAPVTEEVPLEQQMQQIADQPVDPEMQDQATGVVTTPEPAPAPQYGPGLTKVSNEHSHYDTDEYSVDMELRDDPEAGEPSWFTTIRDKETGEEIDYGRFDIEPTEDLASAKDQLAAFLGLEKLPGRPAKGTEVMVDGKPYTVRLHERPRMENPVYTVEINGKPHYFQRSEGMNPGDTAWFEVVKTKKWGWTGIKQAASNEQIHHSQEYPLGYSKEEAVQALTERHKPEQTTSQEPVTTAPEVALEAAPAAQASTPPPTTSIKLKRTNAGTYAGEHKGFKVDLQQMTTGWYADVAGEPDLNSGPYDTRVEAAAATEAAINEHLENPEAAAPAPAARKKSKAVTNDEPKPFFQKGAKVFWDKGVKYYNGFHPKSKTRKVWVMYENGSAEPTIYPSKPALLKAHPNLEFREDTMFKPEKQPDKYEVGDAQAMLKEKPATISEDADEGDGQPVVLIKKGEPETLTPAERERARQRRIKEDISIWNKIFDDQDAIAPVVDRLNSLKIKRDGKVNAVLLPFAEIYNLAVDFVITAVKAGNTLANAVRLGAAMLKENGATAKQIRDYRKEIRDKFGPATENQRTIKEIIKDSTDKTANQKQIVMGELEALKMEARNFNKGYKAGAEATTKEQRAKQKEEIRALKEAHEAELKQLRQEKNENTRQKLADAKAKYETKLFNLKIKGQEKEMILQDLRDEFLEIIEHVRKTGLFTGYTTGQNRILQISKELMKAGSDPRKLSQAIDYVINQFADLDYTNKLEDAKKLREKMGAMYWKNVTDVTNGFLGIDPENLSLEELYEYKAIQQRLVDMYNAHKADNTVHTHEYTPAEFDSIRDFTSEVNAGVSTRVLPDVIQDELQLESNVTQDSGGFLKQLSEDFKHLKTKYLSFRKGLPKEIYKMMEYMTGGINKQVAVAEAEARKLDALVEKEIKTNPDILKGIDAALRGDMDKLNELPDRIMMSVIRMRQHIDKLSQEMIDKGFISHSEMKTFETNRGKYLNRSYELFKNDFWTEDQVPKPIFKKASDFLFNKYYRDKKLEDSKRIKAGIRELMEDDPELDLETATDQYLADNPPLSEQQIRNYANNRARAKITEYFNKDKNEYWNNKRIGAKDLGVLTERQDIDEPLRALFGEIHDPAYNYVNTIYKVAQLAENNRFLHKLRENFEGKLFFQPDDINRPAHASAPIPEGSETYDPLAGLYTTPELLEALEEERNNLQGFLKNYAKFAGYVRMGKTLYSPITHVKNFEGGIGIALSNGTIPIGGDITKSFKAIRANLSKNDNEFFNDIVLPLTEAGLLNNSVTLGTIQDLFGDNSTTEIRYKQRYDRNRSLTEKALSLRDKIHKGVKDAYVAEDDFWKIFTYLKYRQDYSQALYEGRTYDQLNDQEKAELNDKVIELTKNTTPTFSRVPKVAKLGGMALGNFVSFQAEAYRILFNQVKLAYDEVRSDNPGLRKIGAKRMAGLVGYKSLKWALLKTLGQGALNGIIGLFGDDDEETEQHQAIRRFLPEFTRNSDIIALTAENGQLRYIDLSSYDPYGNLERTINAVVNGETWQDSFANAVVEFTSPFADPEITTATALRLFFNKDAYDRDITNPEDDVFPDNLPKAANFTIKSLEPGVTAWARRILTKGDETAEIGAIAVRINKVDVLKQSEYLFRNSEDRRKNIARIYNSKRYSSPDDPEAVEAAYNRANEKLDELIMEMHKDFQAAIKLGVKPNDIVQKLADLNLPGPLMQAVISGNPKAYDIRKRDK